MDSKILEVHIVSCLVWSLFLPNWFLVQSYFSWKRRGILSTFSFFFFFLLSNDCVCCLQTRNSSGSFLKISFSVKSKIMFSYTKITLSVLHFEWTFCLWIFKNILLWSFGKYWFTDYCQFFKYWHITLHNTKKKITFFNITTDLIRKISQ